METEYKIAIVGILFGVGVWFYRAYILPLVNANELKRQYQSAAEPTIIHQVGENDDEFWARVQRERARYEGSGNRWALKQSPVIPFPFNRAFEIDWFGEKHLLSTIGMGKAEYFAAANRTYNTLLAKWQRETGHAFGDDATMAANGQKPFDGNIWGDPGFKKQSAN